MPRLTLGGQPAAGRVEVELWERLFLARPMTRALTLELADLERQVHAAKTSDEAVERLAALIGAVLEPTGGQRKTADVLIVEKWQANELSVQQLMDFNDQLQGRQAPPT